MKKLLRSLSIYFIIIAMIGTAASAAVPGDLAAPQSNSYILKTTVGIVCLGGGKLEVDFSVTTNGQKWPDVGAFFVDICTEDGTIVKSFVYTDPGCEDMMGHNVRTHTSSVFYQGEIGEYYYAMVHFYAGTIGGSGGGDCLQSPTIMATLFPYK